MTDQKIIDYLDQFCVKTGDVEVKAIDIHNGTCSIVVPVFNGENEFFPNQIATLDFEFDFDGEDVTIYKFPKRLLSDEDRIFVESEIADEFSWSADNISSRGEYSMKAVDIEWDVDCQEDLEGLPTEIEIPEGLEDEEDISDYISEVTGFCHKGFRLVENEKDISDSSFVLCMASTKEEYVNSTPSEVYEFNTLQDCIAECAFLRDSAKAKGSPDYFAAYIVAEDGINPWNQVFADLKLTEECIWLSLSIDKCISIWYSPDKQYGDELAMKIEQRGLHGSMGPHCEIICDERYTTSDLSYTSIRKTLQEIYHDADLSVDESDLHNLSEKIISVFNLKKPSLDNQIQSAASRASGFSELLDPKLKAIEVNR